MTIEFEDTPIWAVAEKILYGGATSTNYTWEVIVHTPDENLTPFNVQSINTVRDYAGGFGDEITLSTQFGRGTFAYRILPFRNDLEITLKKIPVTESLDSELGSGKIQSERFKATLIGDFTSPTLGQGKEAKSEEALNMLGLDDIHFQLQDKACEQIRVLMAGGIGRNTTVQNFLTTLITRTSEKLKVGDERALKGIDMVKADNVDVKEHIVITQGVRLVDLADFVQKRQGVYNAGLGSYIQSGYWYIFPLYDTSEFNRRVKTLTMVVVPETKLSNVERTFITEAGATTVLVTGKTAFRDDAGSNYQNFGNGLRYTHAALLMDANSSTSGNKVTLTRDKLNSESISADAPLKFAPVAANRITANPFPNLSLQARKRGGYFRAIWQNGDHALIVPGMVVKIVYFEDEVLKDIYGLVHNVTHVSHKAGAVVSKKFVNQVIIDIFINNQLKPLNE